MTDPDADDLLKLAANTFTPLWTFRGDAENANAPFATLVLVMADRLRQWGTAEAEGQSLSRLLDRCEALFARLPSAPPLGTVLHEKLARIQELIEAGTSASLRLLRTALQEETDPAVLAAILPGLARLGNSNTLNSLLPYLADYRPELRIAAIEAIRITGNIGAALSIFPLASDPVPLVCEKAEKALSEFDSRLLVDQLQTFALLGLPEQRILAIKALCRYPSEDHLTLMRLLADSEHHDVAAAAREAVKDILSRKLDNGKHTPAGISHDVAPVLRKLHGHAIVCGYGRMGRLIVETLLAAGTECVIIKASEERLPTSGPSQAIKTLLGRGEHAANLLAAGISKARYLFAVTNDDSVNLDISLKAKMLLGNLTRLPPRPELSCVAQVFTHQVRMREERAGRHSRDAHRLESLTSAPGFEMHFLDLFAMAARNIVALYPPPSAALRQQLSGQPLHLLLLGAGPVSIRLSALLISLFQGPEHGLLRLTIIDTPERLKKAAFHTLYPRIDQIVDLNLVPMAHEGITPDTLLRLQGLVPFSSIYIMHEDRERAIEIATRAASLARGLVMVMLDTGPIRGRNAPHVPAGIPRMPFPGPCCTPQSFLSEADAAVARALFHAGHPDKEYEWARLPAEQRTPYLLQAAHLPIQLLTIGSRLVANSDAIRDFSFTGTELREMARLEHRRKAVESLLEASQSPTAVEQLRQSAEPALPWESLQEHTRAGLEARIARLPAVLAELGLGITRENSTQGQPRAGRAEFPTRSHSNGSNTRSTRASMRQVTS
ncbi:MAG TPA: NAD-binding protein [Candidatus Ozemobacteraceae bacterium]